MKRRLYGIAILIALASLPSQLFANPTITAIKEGSPGSGEFSISGSGFGLKTPATPILWDNFEDGQDKMPLPSSGKWQALGADGGYYSNVSTSFLSIADTAYSGTMAAYNRFKVGATGPNESFNTSYYVFEPTDELYYSYRWRVEATTEGDGRIIGKLGRSNSNISSPINAYNGPGCTSFSNFGPIKTPHNITVSFDLEAGNLGKIVNQNLLPTGFTSINEVGQWHRHEMFTHYSTPGIDNGEVWFAADGYPIFHTANTVTRSLGESHQQVSVILGLMVAGMINGSETEARFWVDDVYVDNTQARVEICNGPDRSKPIRCELQIPFSWQDSRIDFTYNPGRFLTEGETTYLFVINSGSEVSKAYGQLLAGSTLTIPSIKAPHMLRVLKSNQEIANQ